MFENEVFDRKALNGTEISHRLYNLIIGLVLLWGFLINGILVKVVKTESLIKTNYILFLVFYFVSCFIGITLFKKSDKPLISFIGYNFVVVPFGLILNIFISGYDPEIVMNAILITTFVTMIMVLFGTAFPKFFEKIEGALFIALIAVIIVEFFQILVLKTRPGIMDWIVALIFCGYIGIDWGRANRMPKTVDNAIDGAAALYMDIINLFIRILRILGRSND